MKFNFFITINKSRDEVWKIFDNPENLPKWQPSLTKLEHQSGEPGMPGAVSMLTYKEKEEFTMLETITSRNEPEEFSGVYENPTARTTMKNTFTAIDDKTTKWNVETEFTFKNPVSKLLSPLMKGMISKRVNDDMNRFKKLAESVAGKI